MKQKRIMALILCAVMVCMSFSLPVFSDENRGPEMPAGSLENAGKQTMEADAENTSQEEIYIEVETDEDDVAVEDAEESMTQPEEEDKQEDASATESPEIIADDKEQDSDAEDMKVDEDTEPENGVEDFETLYNEYIEGFGDNETQKQLFARLVEEKRAAGIAVDREIFSEIIAEVISATYDEIMALNQSSDEQNFMQNSDAMDTSSFPSPAELISSHQASSMPYIAASPYFYTNTMVVDKGKIYAAGTVHGCSVGINGDTGALIREPLQSINENGQIITGVKSVSLGSQYSLILKDNRTVWASGINEYNRLGIGTEYSYVCPSAVQVKGENGNGYLENVKNVSAGLRHSIAVKYDGTAWIWGSNSNGQLGTGNRTMSLYPKKITISNVKQAYASKNYTVILTNDGYVYTAGCNDKGQLGDGTKEDRLNFVQVKGENGEGYLDNIVEIAAGDGTVAALDADGTVWTWGHNRCGTLGIGTTTESLTPVKVLKEDGTYLSNIISVAAGMDHHLAITVSGELWGWGSNNYYQLGVGDSKENQLYAVQVKGLNGEDHLNNIVQVAGGDYYTIAVSADRKVYAWGYNYKGQFGTGELYNTYKTPVSAYTVNHVLDDHGDIPEEATPIELNSNTAGYISDNKDIDYFQFTTAMKGTYRVTIDENIHSFLYDTNNKLIPESFDGYELEASQMYYIKVVANESTEYSLVVEPVSKPVDMKITTGMYEPPHTVLYKNNALYGAGFAYDGQLGLDKSEIEVNMPDKVCDKDGNIISDVKKISAGNRYTLILKKDGTVWATGTNDYNKLGITLQEDGSAVYQINCAEQVRTSSGEYLTDVIDISAGNTHSLALKANGTVWAWGSNSHGQLGTGNRVMQTHPVMSGLGLTRIVAIKAGDQVSMALKDDGTIYMWGKNDQQQLGAGSSKNEELYPIKVKGEYGNRNLENIVAIDMSMKCSFALDESGQVWSWGTNANGVLGIGTDENVSFPTKVVKEDGTPLTNMKSISAGNYHAGAVGYDGSVWMWGKNTSRQLGDRTREDRYAAIQPKSTTGDGVLSDVKVLSCGYEYTMAIQKDGTVLGWGYNMRGQFGFGTDDREMHDYPKKAFLIEDKPTEPHSILPSDDTYVSVRNPEQIAGNSNTVLIDYGTQNYRVKDTIAFYKFNVDEINSGEKDIKLRLWQRNGKSNNFKIAFVNDPNFSNTWKEETLNYNGFVATGLDVSNFPIISTAASPGANYDIEPNYYDIDITDYVQIVQDDPAYKGNLTICIYLDTEPVGDWFDDLCLLTTKEYDLHPNKLPSILVNSDITKKIRYSATVGEEYKFVIMGANETKTYEITFDSDFMELEDVIGATEQKDTNAGIISENIVIDKVEDGKIIFTYFNNTDYTGKINTIILKAKKTGNSILNIIVK